MSQRQLFTSSVGQCLPVYYDKLNPGDTVHIDSSLFSRTQTLSSSALTRITEHIDYFFIPYRRIWSLFPQWFTRMSQDVASSVLAEQPFSDHPAINLPAELSKLVLPAANLGRSALRTPNNDYCDEFGILKVHNATRLLDLLGFGINTFSQFHDVSNRFLVNPALICAYHAINKDFYRLTDRSSPNPSLSSMDGYLSDGSGVPSSLNLLSIYYRPWKRDFYTNVEVSPLFGGTYDYNGLNGLTVNTPSSYLSGRNVQLTNISTYGNPSSWDIPESSSGTAINTQSNASLSLDSIRRAGALERYAQLLRFNDKFWNVQMSALFGKEVPDTYDHVYYLGSHHQGLAISDVVSTATTDDSTLGEIAGKGIGVARKNKPIKFTANQHGFVMAIYSATPESDYLAYGIDRLNTHLSINDFYQPQYDELGMQPKYAYESNFVPDPARNSVVLGWTYRWQELKSKPDLVHGGFVGPLRYWVTSRSNQTQNISYNNFCISPSYLDSIMLVIFGLDGVPFEDETQENAFLQSYIGSTFGRDPLLHELYFKVLKLSEMSKFSLPNHNDVLL